MKFPETLKELLKIEHLVSKRNIEEHRGTYRRTLRIFSGTAEPTKIPQNCGSFKTEGP